jgi:tetratricopeptide (TPR) repeat protein
MVADEDVCGVCNSQRTRSPRCTRIWNSSSIRSARTHSQRIASTFAMADSKDDLSTAAYEAKLAEEVDKLRVGDRTTEAAEDDEHFDGEINTSQPASSSSSAAAAASSTDAFHSSASTSASIEEIIEKDPAKALAAKVRGNEFFARQAYPNAIEEYSQAIALAPDGPEATQEQKEQLAIYYSNRAACHLMQQAYEATISDCTASLDLVPKNAKPLGRRAKAYEALDQLAEAVEDYKLLVSLDSTDRDSSSALVRTEKKLNEKNEAMKKEMLDKLKGFGNTILGKFGMSLDSFKATQDPSTGSYNISFGK